jgi:hypothetical protein
MFETESDVFDFKLSSVIVELAVEPASYPRLCFNAITPMKVHAYRWPSQ